MRKNSDAVIFTTIVGVLFVIILIVSLASCRSSGGGNTYYYPQDTSHGYYDTHHHYHYYPKYNPKSRSYVKPKSGGFGVKVKPAPKSGGGFSFRKSGGSGYKSGGFKSSTRR